METKEERINLQNLGDGVIEEKFQMALDEIIKDITDPNTDAKSTREINIKITIKPDEDRQIGTLGIHVSKKIGGLRPFMSKIIFGREENGVGARELKNTQQNFFKPKAELVSLKKGETTDVS